MTNACLTAAGALRPTGKPNQSDWDSNQSIRTLTAAETEGLRSLITLEPGMLAQMSGHLCPCFTRRHIVRFYARVLNLMGHYALR